MKKYFAIAFLILLPLLFYGQKYEYKYNPLTGKMDMVWSEDSLLAVLDERLTLYDLDLWYGIQYDITSSDPVCTKIGNTSYHTTLPVHSAMYPAVIQNDKTINYLLDETNFNLKANGSVAVTDGTDGQCMVVVPTHYRKFEQDGNIRRVKISQYPLTGFDTITQFAIGITEGVYTTSDTLSSIFGDTAKTSQTRAQFRTAAAKRGSGWCQLDYESYQAIVWLYMVEYASWNSQDSIGAGASNASSGDWSTYNAYNPIFQTGKVIKRHGMVTGNYADTVPAFPSGTDTLFTNHACYRGIEDIFGHIFKFVDGININEHIVYTNSDQVTFADNTATNYTLLGTAPSANGYISRLIAGSIVPSSSTGGSSSTYMCDYYYQSTGWRVAAWGGALYYGALGGLLSARFDLSSGYSGAYVGSRLCLKF